MDNLTLREKLENRLLEFSKKVHDLIKKLPKDRINQEYSDQLNRSSCSIGANYIEANEAESRRDFFHRIKICRKESKESGYWLTLIQHSIPTLSSEIAPWFRKQLNMYASSRRFSVAKTFRNS